MSDNTELTHKEIEAIDFLARAETIQVKNCGTCPLNRHWTPPRTYLEWARGGLAADDEHGLADAITYAKRAACCRIDHLIHNYHLGRLHRLSFPSKITALEGVGLEIPSIIQELIIDPRNELEHDYVPANRDTARRACEIAQMFVTTTDEVDHRDSVIAVNMNLSYSHSLGRGGEHVTFNGWHDGAMIFMDIFAERPAAKIVDGVRGEVVFTELSNFARKEAIQLGRILHTASSHSSRGTGQFFYTELGRLAGF